MAQMKLESTGITVEQILVTNILSDTGSSVVRMSLQASESLLPNSDLKGFGFIPIVNA